jgi:hypothetical protein
MAEEVKCAHLQVVYRKWEVDGKVIGEKWLCDVCKKEFYPLPEFFGSGQIQVMEPQATLRDQFAMAALTGLLADPAVRGTQIDTQKAFMIADWMMEARNK